MLAWEHSKPELTLVVPTQYNFTIIFAATCWLVHRPGPYPITSPVFTHRTPFVSTHLIQGASGELIT
jgi:hypothetical protein